MSISIEKTVRDFVKKRGKYAQVYNNQISSLHNNFRNEIFAIKSFLTNSKYKDEKLYIPINFMRLISHIYADYEIGEGCDIKFSDETEQEQREKLIEENDIDIDDILHDRVIKKSYMGYSILKVRKDGDLIRLDKIPNANYFPDSSGTFLGARFEDIKVHTMMSVVKEKMKTYTHIESYKKVAGGWETKYEVHNYNALFTYDEKTLVETKERSGEVIEYLPIRVFNNDIIEDETSKKKDDDQINILEHILGVSDYVDLLDLNQDLNDRQTQISVEFIKHLQSKMSLPQSYIQHITDKRAKYKQVAKREGRVLNDEELDQLTLFEYITHKDGEKPAQYITKDNKLLSSALEEKRELIRYMSAISRVPKKYFGLEEKSGNGHVETGNQELEVFYKKVQKKRNKTKRVIKQVVKQIMAYAGYEAKTLSVSFKPLKVKNEKQIAETMVTLFVNQLVSKKTALQRIFDRDEERVEKEIENIQEDQSVLTAIDGETTSLFDNIQQ